MNIERYTHDHYPEIEQWFEKWEMKAPPKTMLPIVGYVCTGVAAGFVYRTDSSVCMIEHFISNKDVDKEIVSKALDEIVENLILTMKSEGFETIMAYSSNDKVIERAKKFDFSIPEKNYIMMHKEISWVE